MPACAVVGDACPNSTPGSSKRRCKSYSEGSQPTVGKRGYSGSANQILMDFARNSTVVWRMQTGVNRAPNPGGELTGRSHPSVVKRHAIGPEESRLIFHAAKVRYARLQFCCMP